MWRTKKLPKYPGWEYRRVVTGGYKMPIDSVIHVPRHVRYEITYLGKYFFTTETFKQVKRIVAKYSKLM